MDGDVKCPYCGHEWQEDPWYDVAEYDGEEVELECPICEKDFKASLHLSIDAWFEVDENDYKVDEEE